MAYDSKQQILIVEPAVDLDATVSTPFTMVIPSNAAMHIHQCYFLYTEATDAAVTTLGAVSLDVTPSGGSRTEYAIYTAELSKAIGTTGTLLNSSSRNDQPSGDTLLTTEFDTIKLGPGDTLHLEHKTEQTDMEAGAGKFVLAYEMIPQVDVG